LKRRKPVKEQPSKLQEVMPLLVIPASAVGLLVFVLWLLVVHHDCVAKAPAPDTDVVNFRCEPLVGVEKKRAAPSTADLLNHLVNTHHYQP
jgi:hypothetical protein